MILTTVVMFFNAKTEFMYCKILTLSYLSLPIFHLQKLPQQAKPNIMVVAVASYKQASGGSLLTKSSPWYI